VLLHKCIHTSRIGVENGTHFGAHHAHVDIRGAAEIQFAKIFVDFERGGTENLGELTSSGAPQQIHLPQAVLRQDVTLRLRKVLGGGGANVRNSPFVAFDGYFSV